MADRQPTPGSSDRSDLDLTRSRRIHVCNVGGAGMSAVATLLAEMGHRVSGHDPVATTPFMPMLLERGVNVSTGPRPPALGDDVEAVIVSTATPRRRPISTIAARSHGIPIWSTQRIARVRGVMAPSTSGGSML